MTLPARLPDVVAVDDDETTRAIVAGVLERHGIAVLVCANGSEMWRALDAATPKVVILDVEMPGEDGFLLAERLRARYGYGIAIVMLTGHGLSGDIRVGMEVGADDYLTKPCDWRRLVSVVDRLLHPAVSGVL
jgi:DNA-binding response OmpR family regulator